MRSSAVTVFALLDAEWASLAHRAVPGCWHGQPALRVPELLQPTLGDLVQVTERRGDPARSDRVLAALARLASGAEGAAHDPLAARTMLQMLLPGAKAVARRLGWLGDAQERAAAVTAALYEQIRTYPIERRPARIAANLLADTHQRLLRRSGRAAPALGPAAVSLEALAAHGEGVLPEAAPMVATPAEELLALLAWAVHSGHLTGAQARLIGQTRIGDTPCEELGERAGLAAHSLRRRRQRAEQALGRAASAHALAPDDLVRLLPLPSRCA
jgi:hypothetical protein